MQIETFIVDTFTSTPFRGNPTAVCYHPAVITTEKMQAIATELNFPVTAFVNPLPGNAEEYSIRYFTVTTEIPACGHATLAGSAILFSNYNRPSVTFYTAGGVCIRAEREEQIILLRYPVYTLQTTHTDTATLQSLGLRDYLSAGLCPELETLFIELADETLLYSIQPDFKALVKSHSSIKEVVVHCSSGDSRYDYLLRSFCPWIGINEDPVTGSVHSVLAGYWSARINKPVLKVYQASERGGELLVKSGHEHVQIGGEAVILLKGEMFL